MRRLTRVLTTLLAVVLTAKLGTIQNGVNKETWYDLNMSKVVERADAFYGLHDVYAVRDDGVKTYNGFVIVATNYETYPYGTVIPTSLGLGLVLDTGEFAKESKNIVDIATNWKRGQDK